MGYGFFFQEFEVNLDQTKLLVQKVNFLQRSGMKSGLSSIYDHVGPLDESRVLYRRWSFVKQADLAFYFVEGKQKNTLYPGAPASVH
jgi:hypothetical protein